MFLLNFHWQNISFIFSLLRCLPTNYSLVASSSGLHTQSASYSKTAKSQWSQHLAAVEVKSWCLQNTEKVNHDTKDVFSLSTNMTNLQTPRWGCQVCPWCDNMFCSPSLHCNPPILLLIMNAVIIHPYIPIMCVCAASIATCSYLPFQQTLKVSCQEE